MSSAVEQKIGKLRRELERHNYLYYLGTPEINDREFDAMMRELIELEKAHPELVTADSPSQRVGGQPIEGFKTVEHAMPMMSIDNTYDEAEVRAFDARVRKGLGEEEKIAYVIEPKVDGVAASVRYERGALVLAATRGDGRRGDDITVNARTIQSIPLRLHGDDVPDVLEVRGEIYMSSAVFQRINKEREEAGEEIFKNPRNLAVGALKQLDPKITASRKLRFVAHGLGQAEPMPAKGYWDCLKLFKNWHLPVGEQTSRANSVDEVIGAIEKFAEVRGKLAYQTDGVVIKVDNFEQRERLGATSKAPRWVIAYKYAAEQMQTVLRAVDWQVGKQGTLTPVARLAPVFLAGSTVQNATLHNIDQIRRLDLHLGDTVVVEKAGEVIPYVRQAIVEKRPRNAKSIQPPTHCPSCGSQTEKEPDEPFIRCVNPTCPGQLLERLIWFAGRRQMDIDGLGNELIEHLVVNKKLHGYADFFDLKTEDIANITRDVIHREKKVMQRVGDKVAVKIIKSIQAAKSRGLSRVLAGINISHVGDKVARDLATWAGDIDRLLKATPLELRNAITRAKLPDNLSKSAKKTAEKILTAPRPQTSVSLFGSATAFDGQELDTRNYLEKRKTSLGLDAKSKASWILQLGAVFPTTKELFAASQDELRDAIVAGVVATSFYRFARSKAALQIFRGLKERGVKLSENRTATIESEFAGKTVVITGTFAFIGRDELKDRLARLGANVTGSVSGSTNLVLAGESPGSKLARAKELGVMIWTEEQLLKKLPSKS